MQDGSLPLNMIIDQVGRDKNLDKDVLIEAIEAAILTAAKKTFGAERDLEARFNEETGVVDLYQYMTVVDVVENPEREISVEDAKAAGLPAVPGEELGFQIFYLDQDEQKAKEQDREFGKILGLKTFGRGFGRIAAQAAKQVIIQRVRDAERENIYNEYKDRKGELITGIVRRFERNHAIIVDLGRTEAVIPAREQAPRESYRPGDRVLAYVADIDREAKGPQIVLSRTHPGLLEKLFEMEVPEIYEGIVRIVAVAREPGSRSKVAVASRDADVDPVGACVGMRGARVQAVVQELRGERIDIVPWDTDPARFVCNAIAPAEVSRVIIDDVNNTMELVVPDDKLSLAIGRRGQNVRLASQLTGWKLDVVSETDFQQREQEAIAALAEVEGISEDAAQTMYRLGFRTVEEVAEADPAELVAIPGMGDEERIARLQEAAAVAMEQQRKKKLLQLIARSGGSMSERDRLLFIPNIGERTIELLVQAGYKRIDAIAQEEDLDRLALSTGLSMEKARHLVEGARHFVANEKEIVAAMRSEVEEWKRQEAFRQQTAAAAEEATAAQQAEDGDDAPAAQTPADGRDGAVEDPAAGEIAGDDAQNED